MLHHLARTALTLAVLASAVACSSTDDNSGGFTLRIGATSPTGTPAGSLGWGDKEGTLAPQLKDAGVDNIEYSFFQSGSDVASALFAGAIDVAAIGDNPALRARSRDPKVVLLALDSISSDAWRQAVTAVNRDIQKNFEEYATWVAQTDGTDVEFVKESTRPDEFNTEPFPAEGVDQLEAAYDFLNADGSLENQYSVREWAGAQS